MGKNYVLVRAYGCVFVFLSRKLIFFHSEPSVEYVTHAFFVFI